MMLLREEKWMFCEKLKQLLGLLGTTASEFAAFAGCDKAYISRLLSGRTVPKKGGAGLKRLAENILLLAEKEGKEEELLLLLSPGRKTDARDLFLRLTEWLFEGETDSGSTVRQNEIRKSREFGKKLSALMELTGLSNVRLGRSLSIDPSYVSRFRNGLRSPDSNPKLMDALCSLILERVTEQGKTAHLAELTGISQECFTDPEEAFESLYGWLFSTGRMAEEPYIEELIGRFGEFTQEIMIPQAPFAEEYDADVLEERNLYYGTKGLRKAVLRFLSEVIRREEKELLLYSDQNMDWMDQDVRFRQQWAGLMGQCVSRGTRVVIIHNLNRNLDEMTDAIRNWLPLYMTGRVQSYYSTRKKGERFSTTLFLCPGYACIHGSNAVGAEDEAGVYRYDTAPEILASERASFDMLLRDSKALVRIYEAGSDGFMKPQNGGEGGQTDAGIAADPHVKDSLKPVWTLPEDSGEEVRILMSDHAVALQRLKAPYFAVFSEHPALYRAFSAYIGKLKKERDEEGDTHES